MTSAGGEGTSPCWTVVGASGFVGQGISRALRAADVEVRACPAPRLELSPEATAHQVQEEAEGAAVLEDLAASFHGSDVVVNAAGVADSGAHSDQRLFGANALLPAVLALAAGRAGVPRFLHLSSAAVQGRTTLVDETRRLAAFSPYSASKALGEEALWLIQDKESNEAVPLRTVIIRASSVQGEGRGTTDQLTRVARSPLASVAGDGSQPSPVSSLGDLARVVVDAGEAASPPGILLQPWTGISVAQVLRDAGGREPKHLPRRLCRALLAAGWPVAQVTGPRAVSRFRQVEVMWFGQQQSSSVSCDTDQQES